MHYLLTLSIFLCLMVQAITAQDYINRRTAPEKIKQKYKKAYTLYSQKDYNSSKKALDKLEKKCPNFVDTYLLKGRIAILEKDYNHAQSMLQKAVKLAPKYSAAPYLQLAKLSTKFEDFGKTQDYLQAYLEFERINKRDRSLAEKMLADAIFRPQALKNPVPFNPINLGPNVNTPNREYFPCITLKNELVYTAQSRKGQQLQEDLAWTSKEEGVWQKGIPLPFNTNENEAAQSISADGQLIVFTVCNRPGDFGSCDLYFSEKIKRKWSTPKNIGTSINTGGWESQPSITPNADGLFFVRGGAKGRGHKDIYYSPKQVDGSWGKPTPVKAINTGYNEEAPFIHPDGQSLYFSSNGHPGMGKSDLFISRKQADGYWGQPENLGYPLNSEKHEESISIALNGKDAFIASDRTGGYGSLDLYQIEVPEKMRPKSATYITGRTQHAFTKKALSAQLTLTNLETAQTVYTGTSDANGIFTICLATGEYALTATKDGFTFFSANYTIKEAKDFKEPYQLLANLQPIEAASNKNDSIQSIVLENIFFKSGSAILLPKSFRELNQLFTLLEQNPSMQIEIHGHTDNQGTKESNQVLSEQRARAVVQYLQNKKVNPNRMLAKGFGESMPRASNDTAKGRASNRRTEFIIKK